MVVEAEFPKCYSHPEEVPVTVAIVALQLCSLICGGTWILIDNT
jgi:hypothetical protein